ncbi:MAG: hypothetical protein R2875_08220 [Desulfobacterales bacterium]
MISTKAMSSMVEPGHVQHLFVAGTGAVPMVGIHPGRSRRLPSSGDEVPGHRLCRLIIKAAQASVI